MRIGWVIASRIPAIALASVARAAKPTTRPSTAEEARMPVATWRTGPNCQTANASPTTMISAKIRRRTSRSRVLATGDSSPPTTRCERPFPAGQHAVHHLGHHERRHHDRDSDDPVLVAREV